MRKATIYILLGFLLGIGSTTSAATETIQATFAKFNIIVNGESQTLSADPILYQGTTYLPLRLTANMLGYDVLYKSDAETIELNNGQQLTTQSIGKEGESMITTDKSAQLEKLNGKIEEVTKNKENYEIKLQSAIDEMTHLGETEEYINKDSFVVNMRHIISELEKSISELEAEKAQLEAQQ